MNSEKKRGAIYILYIKNGSHSTPLGAGGKITSGTKTDLEETDCEDKVKETFNIVFTCGFQYALIKTVNTDVFITATALILHFELKEMWIASGNGLHRINIPIHASYQQLGHDKSTGLLFSY